jgi:GNAT superfamily N-acetyltransferase
MNITFSIANQEDVKTVFECIIQLQDKKYFDYAEFKEYWLELLNNRFAKNDIWVGKLESTEICAYIAVNYFSLPTYLGFGVELQEVVTLPKYQQKGIGRKFLQFLKHHYSQISKCRKIIIKTNDIEGAGRLYNKEFNVTNMITYQAYLNKL